MITDPAGAVDAFCASFLSTGFNLAVVLVQEMA
jgi:hypothetical protein